jgi:hypothetical protein
MANSLLLAVRKYADISTGHITEKDSQLMTALGQRDNSLLVSAYPEGFFIRLLDSDCYTPAYEQEILEMGFSKTLYDLLTICAYAGFQGIQFDCDGPHYEQLETFDW